MIISNVKNLLKQYNKNRPSNISIRELARITGVSRSSLMKLVNNQARSISFNTLNELSEFFNVNTSDIIKHDDGAYLVNLDNIKHIPIDLSTASGANNHLRKCINDSIAISCHEIPNTYFILIPFIKNHIHNTYKIDICCRCSYVSSLSQEAQDMQYLINLFPRKLMTQILYILLTRIIVSDNSYNDMATNASTIYFGNYAPVNILLNNMINFSNYKIVAPYGIVNTPDDSNIENHKPIKLNDYNKNDPFTHDSVVKIYDHTEI